MDNTIRKIKEILSEEDIIEIKKNGEQQPQITVPQISFHETIINQYNQKLKDTNYTISEGRLCFKKAEDDLVPLCNFIPFITRETSEDDGVDRKLMYHVNGVMIQQESIFPEIYLPAENFPSLNWVQSSWGLRANIEPGHSVKDRIRHASQLISTDCIRDYIYTHIGWRKIYGQWIYLHSGGAIGKENVTVKLESKQLEKYQLPDDEEIDLKQATLASLELLKVAELDITLPLMAMVGLAPLCEPLKAAGIEPAFVIWIAGPSGSRKSSLVACVQSHFGKFNSGKDLPASFRDTMNAIEKKAFLTKDSLLVVDDYHPTYSSQESKRMEQIAQQILRGYGDRVGRSRMKADTSLQKAYPPRGICLITGEDTPKAGISTTARFLEIELTSNSINLERLEKCQEKNSYFSYAFKGYIQWLLPQMPMLPAVLKKKFDENRNRFFNKDTHGRVTETISWLLVGLEMLLTFYVHTGAIDNDQKEKTMAIAVDKFNSIAKKHALNLNSHDPVMLFTEGLLDLINSEAVNIIDIKEDPYTDHRHFIGWEDNEYYYFLTASLMKEINLFFQGQGQRFPISKYMLLKMLAERHLIEVEKSKNEVRNTVREYVGKQHKQIRVLKLKKSALL